jgi:predicted dehydrogenase
MENVKFGILGCGNISDAHITALKEVCGVEFYAVCDVNRAKAEEYAEKYKVKAFTDYEEMLHDEKIDAVAICTPSGMHKNQALLALKANKHVIVEKPMALTSTDCAELCSEAEKSDKLLSVVFQLRFNEDIQRAKKIIEDGVLGTLAFCDLYMKYWREESYYAESAWRGTFKMDGGGALMNQGIHGIDLINYLFGVPKLLGAKVKTRIHKIETEDTAVAIVEYPSGALGVIEGSTSSNPGFHRRVEINGSRGYMTLVDSTIEKLFVDGKMLVDKELSTSGGSASDPKATSHAGHIKQYTNFVEALSGKEKLVSSPKDGYNAVALIEEIYNKSKEA